MCETQGREGKKQIKNSSQPAASPFVHQNQNPFIVIVAQGACDTMKDQVLSCQ